MNEQMRTDSMLPETDLEGTILGEGVTMGTDMYQTKLNNNCIVFGTPGGGKTQSVVKPNIMQLNSSYVVTDPKGSLMGEVGPMLEAAGYRVECLDFTDWKRSNTYNPLAYVRDEDDVKAIADMIVHAEGKRSEKDLFWDDSALMLAETDISMAFAYREHGTPTFSDVLAFADAEQQGPRLLSGVRTRAEEMMEEVRLGIRIDHYGTLSLARGRENQFAEMARNSWQRFKSVDKAESTKSCIVAELWSVLNKLSGKGREHLFSDESPIDLGAIGKEKTALFIIVSDTDRSIDFMVSVFYSQLFKELCHVADKECGGRLDVPVRVILDDFANQGRINHFETLIAAVRSRDIWLMPICQSTSQLEQLYGPAAETIMGCCDSSVYIGVNDMSTARELRDRLNMPLEDVQSMPIGKGIVFMRGQKPQVVKRYDPSRHPNARFLTDGRDERDEFLVKGCELAKIRQKAWERGHMGRAQGKAGGDAQRLPRHDKD